MKNKLIRLIALLLTAFVFNGCFQPGNQSSSDLENNPNEEEKVHQVEREYYEILNNPENLPLSFVYEDVYYKGLSPAYFKKVSQTVANVDGGLKHTTVYRFGDLDVTLISAVYPEYSAYDYTVYFANNSAKNSGVIRYLNAIDAAFNCDGARLKGIYGDYDYQYKPYDFDLSKEDVSFVSTRGRATHTYFPYFNLEAKNNGTIIALGWAGTWNASFSYDKAQNSARVAGGACNDLCTYLKPGETVRTPLVALVRYYGADEDTAMNMWRRWYIDCNMPYEDNTKTQKVDTHDFYYSPFDLPQENIFASLEETPQIAKTAMDALFKHGIEADYWWLDAGWYESPSGEDIGEDWWGKVGAWSLDKGRWPGNALLETSNYFKDKYGVKSLMWFEPERVSDLDSMVKYHNYNKEWALTRDGRDNVSLNNLGVEGCVEWTYDKIVGVMKNNNMDLYREDFNIDPAPYWAVGDAWQGENRVGITENLYIQGHYALWDKILDFASETDRPTFIDSCASGGGRNDLETMRRAVPLMRSDAEGSTISLRLAMTTTFTKWIPYTGCFDKEAVSQVARGTFDEYSLRATMFPSLLYSFRTSNKVDQNAIQAIKKFQQERKEYKKYFYSDFYVLTDYNGVNEDRNWTAYMYFDPSSDSGVISAFRQANCDKDTCTVSVKGVNPNNYYLIRDIDGVNSIARVKGSALINGYPIYAKNARKALILYIEPAN